MSFGKRAGKRIMILLCLLVSVGILWFNGTSLVHATEEHHLETGETVTSTTVDPAGTYDDPDDMNTVNTVNRISLTYEGDNGSLNGSLQILITLTLISLAPTIIIMMTSFTRIIIVLHFTRAALNTQTAPPNQVLIGLALILTFFIMSPTINQINEQAYIPYQNGEVTTDEFMELAMEPLREFMYPQTQLKDVQLFIDIADLQWDGELDTIPNSVLIPAFMISELRTAFWIGFMIYIPFLVIDMVVASTLMSMGMMMLPPTTISMPFKILLFVLADGWALIIGQVVKTFY